MKTLNIIRAGICLMAVAGLSFGSAAIAANPTLTLTPASDWKVTKKTDRCRMTRNFGEGENVTRLTIEKGGAEPSFNLTVTGQPVRNPVGPLISLQFGPNEKPIGRDYITANTPSGRPAIVMYGADFSPSISDGDGGFASDTLDAERLTAIEYLQIERAGMASFRLETGPMADAMKSLSECAYALTGALAVSDTGQSRSPEPRSNPQRWLKTKDYPPLMFGYKQDGAINFRLTVNANGKPTFCVIENASVPQMFDDSVCLALLKRAEFKPALDWEGNPTASYWRSWVRFYIK